MCLMKKDQCHLYFGLTNAEDRTKIMKGDAIMKRKIMAVLLAAAMTGSLAGCGSTQNKNAADASEEKMKFLCPMHWLFLLPGRVKVSAGISWRKS